MILILDFGSQYTQLIARRVREAQVYCEIHPYSRRPRPSASCNPRALSCRVGRPVYTRADAPRLEAAVVDTPVPFLGICYGMGVLHQLAGAQMVRPSGGSLGAARLFVDDTRDLFRRLLQHRLQPGLDEPRRQVRAPAEPAGRCWPIRQTLRSRPAATPRAACSACSFIPRWRIPSTDARVLHNFLFRVCGCRPDWTMEGFVEHEIARLRQQVGDGRGGVRASAAGLIPQSWPPCSAGRLVSA